eukprot:gene22089-gene812
MSLHKVRLESNSTRSSFPVDTFNSVPLTAVSPDLSVDIQGTGQKSHSTRHRCDEAECYGLINQLDSPC